MVAHVGRRIVIWNVVITMTWAIQKSSDGRKGRNPNQILLQIITWRYLLMMRQLHHNNWIDFVEQNTIFYLVPRYEIINACRNANTWNGKNRGQNHVCRDYLCCKGQIITIQNLTHFSKGKIPVNWNIWKVWWNLLKRKGMKVWKHLIWWNKKKMPI